jgi:MurNAc alpha-1-phosphate uridylyltransferase
LITGYPQQRQKFPLGEVLRFGISQNRISAKVYTGKWSDVGTPERLAQLDAQLIKNNENTLKIISNTSS